MTTTSSPPFVLPTAQDQTSLAPDAILHSGNAGVIVERVGQLRAEFRSEARQFARELSEYLNTNYAGIISVFVYEETFGTKDRLHWLMHLKSLHAYETLIRMGSQDAGWRDIIMRQRIEPERGGGTWDRMFLDGALHETVLIPSAFGMYGTSEATPDSVNTDEGAATFVVPTAQLQTDVPIGEQLNSATCGILMHRTGEAALRVPRRGPGVRPRALRELEPGAGRTRHDLPVRGGVRSVRPHPPLHPPQVAQLVLHADGRPGDERSRHPRGVHQAVDPAGEGRRWVGAHVRPVEPR